MKSDITHANSRPQRHTERLDGAIQVLVINRVFIVPNTWGGVRYLIAYKTNPIDSWNWLQLVDRRSGPGIDRRQRSHRGADGGKGETGGATNTKLPVGDIIVHVALPRMRLAPGVFMWRDVLTFGKVGRASILSCVKVAHWHQDPVGRPCVGVAGVVICR